MHALLSCQKTNKSEIALRVQSSEIPVGSVKVMGLPNLGFTFPWICHMNNWWKCVSMSSSYSDSKLLIPFIQLKSWSIRSKVWLLTSNFWKSLYQFQFLSNSGICYKLHKMTTTVFFTLLAPPPGNIYVVQALVEENINFIWRQVHSPKELHNFCL